MNYSLQLKLLSDTTFGRGDGVAGLIDVEVEHDECGLPFLRGRALKGMLVYECADILLALKQQKKLDVTDLEDPWIKVARFLFGESGGTLTGEAALEISDARLPDELRGAIEFQMRNMTPAQKGQLRHEVLNGLTTVRRQTKVEVDGVAADNSLRASRLILRETQFTAQLWFKSDDLTSQAKGLLAACVNGLRRAGTRRQRGTGLLEAKLYEGNQDITSDWFKEFEMMVTK